MSTTVPQYPWKEGDPLFASALNGAIANGGWPGGPFLPLTGGVVTTTYVNPTGESIGTTFQANVTLTSDNANDIITMIGRLAPNTGGHHMASFHCSAFYGVATPFDTVAGGTIDTINAFMGQSGNQGKGTVTNAIDFHGHANVNSGGGVLTNHYFLYQEQSSAAVNHYGAYFSAPVGIGTQAPGYNLDVGTGVNLSSTNWARLGPLAVGMFTIGSNGASIFPGYNPGAGGLGVQDLIVGYNGAQNATTATTAFLYISSCAGTPTGIPVQAATGRVALTYDTTAHKLWMHDGTSWRGVVLT